MHSDDSYIIFNVMNWQNCHDLANWLSHYLYFFSFLFFSYLQLQECGKVSRDFVTMSQWCDGGSQWSHHRSQSQWSHDKSNMRTMGKQAHSHSSKVYK